mgnify:CR=1 FL=1
MAYFAIDALAISIHAPRTGSDDFLVIFRVACCISIHAPRTGSDAVEQRTNLGAGYFNPRSPHGERLFSDAFDVRLQHFNPRSPHGERRVRIVFRW